MNTQTGPSETRSPTLEIDVIHLNEAILQDQTPGRARAEKFAAIKTFVESRSLTSMGSQLSLAAAQALEPLLRFVEGGPEDTLLTGREDIDWRSYCAAANGVIDMPVRRLRLIPPSRESLERALRPERHWNIGPTEPSVENAEVAKLLEAQIGLRFRRRFDGLGVGTGDAVWENVLPFIGLLMAKAIVGDVPSFERYARFVSLCGTVMPLGRTQYRLILIAG